MNKNVLKQLSYGMYAISTLDNGRDVGCIANSVMQVTYDTVVVSLNHNNYTNECLNRSQKFAVSILGEDIDNDIIASLGFQSGLSDLYSEMPNDMKDVASLKILNA